MNSIWNFIQALKIYLLRKNNCLFTYNHIGMGIFYLLIFICYFITLSSFKQNSPRWGNEIPVFGWDTASYLYASVNDPWKSIRTPGYLWYLKSLRADEPLRILHEDIWKRAKVDDYIVQMNTRIKNDATLKFIANKIFIANCVLLALGCTFLAFALSKFTSTHTHTQFLLFSLTHNTWSNKLVTVFLIWLSIKLSYLPPLTYMYADSLVAIILTFTLSFLLLYFRSHNLWCLSFACIAAIYSSLVKPSFYFLTLICGIICAIILIKNLITRNYSRALKVLIIACVLTICSLAWPILLYIKGGIFIPSQISHVTKYVISYFLTRNGDENLEVNEKSRLLIKKIIEQQPEIVELAKKKKIKYPYSNLADLQRYYINTFDLVAWERRYKIWNELELPKGYLSYSTQINDFSPEIIKAHRSEYIRLLLSNFIGAFNLLPKVRNSYAWWISEHYLLAFLAIGMALVFGLKSFRLPIALFASAHILHAAFCSYGGIVGPRYMESTEFIIFLSLLLSIYSLSLRLLSLFLDFSAKRKIENVA